MQNHEFLTGSDVQQDQIFIAGRLSYQCDHQPRAISPLPASHRRHPIPEREPNGIYNRRVVESFVGKKNLGITLVDFCSSNMIARHVIRLYPSRRVSFSFFTCTSSLLFRTSSFSLSKVSYFNYSLDGIAASSRCSSSLSMRISRSSRTSTTKSPSV